MSYFELEPEFHKGKVKNSVNIKRALYNFEKAVQADEEHKAEIYYMIAACKKELHDYVGGYEAITSVPNGEYLREFLCDYHELRAQLAYYNCKAPEAVENYERASNLADNRDDSAKLLSGLFATLQMVDIPDERIAAANLNYQRIFTDITPYSEYHKRGDKIKVGYVSANFCQHPHFAALFGMVAAHNREKFEVTCYSLNNTVDQYTNLYKRFAEHFEVVDEMTCEEIAKKVHDDNIDILIDPDGHGLGNALTVFAYKPAPVQISGVGYPATTGLTTVDYFITDETINPPEDAKLYTEKLLHLPVKFCYAQREDVPTPEYAPCTKRDYPVFGTVCSYMEMNDDILNIWKKILELVPNAVLLMRANEFASVSTIDQLYARMKKLGFNMDQILFRPNNANYMAELMHIDVILDVYPQAGGGSTVDALYMGIPVVTFYADRRSSRYGKSLTKIVGIPDLATDSVAGYINRAVGLVRDVNTLDTLHKNLRNMVKKSEPLNPKIYMTILEQKFEEMLAAKETVDENTAD